MQRIRGGQLIVVPDNYDAYVEHERRLEQIKRIHRIYKINNEEDIDDVEYQDEDENRKEYIL